MGDGIVLIGALSGIAVSLIGVWVWIRPAIKRTVAGADAILGREAVTDRSGRAILPASPGLVDRVRTVEDTLALLADNSQRLAEHEQRISQLELQVLERIVTKAESAQMWRAVAEHEIKGDRDDE